MLLTTVFEEKTDTPCAGCVVRDNQKFTEGRIWQSALWDVSQDFEIAYPGMVVISPLRHVSAYMDLTEKELKELHRLTVECEKAIVEIFGCRETAYMFYEKDNGHVHFVIIPLHGKVEVRDKYAVLAELIKKAPALKADPANLHQVREAIMAFRAHFSRCRK